MPRVWGAWTTTSGGVRFRLGFDYSISGTSIKVSQYVAESIGWVRDNVTLTRTGIGKGTMRWYFNRSSAGVSAIPNSGFTHKGVYGGKYTVGGKLTDMVYNHQPSVSASISIPSGKPTAPSRPSTSNAAPTSIRVSWGASSSSNGSSITGYLLRYYPRGSATGTYVNVSEQNNRARTVTGLNPGQLYTFVVLARNANGYSPASPPKTIRMMAGAWIKVDGVWRLAEPYVRHNGSWKPAVPYVRHNGSWKLTT